MPSAQSRGSVLVVDDDPGFGYLLCEAFEEAGFRTQTALTAEEALSVLRAEPVDLVVCDFVMPEVDGLELCQLLRHDLRLSDVKIVLYSANTDATYRRRAREMGAVDYLPKIADAGALVERICEAAGLGAPTRRNSAPGPAPHADFIRSVAFSVGQLKALSASLPTFLQLGAPEGSPPAARVASEAAQRTTAEIQRVLRDLEGQLEKVSG